MAQILRFKGSTKSLGRIGDILAKPFEGARGRAAAKRTKAVVLEQLRQGGRFGPSGTVQRFLPVESFGSRPASRPPLKGPGGSIGRAVSAGRVQTSGKRFSWTIDHPGATTQHAGATINVTPRMRRFLAAKYGVHVKKPQIRIPSRPFAATDSPQMRKAAASPVVEAIRKETR